MPIVRVLIVDDHPIFSKGLSSLICSQPLYTVIGEAKNHREAMEIAEKQAPELAIVDLNLGNEDGLDVIKDIHVLYPKITILVLSMHDERYYAERAIKAGASGYIMKEEAGNSVLNAIKTVLSGKIWLSKTEREREADNIVGADNMAELSDRQLEIFSLIGSGLGTVEIAAKLHLSRKTIDSHKENIKMKLHCGTSQELRQLAVSWNSTK